MKNNKQTISFLVGEGDELTKEICECLAKEGITAIVRQKTEVKSPTDELISQLRGEAGKDLFFNGWKLLF